MAKNHASVDAAVQHLIKVEIPSSWASLETPIIEANPESKRNASSKAVYLEEVAKPMLHLDGDSLPVSVFSPSEGVGDMRGIGLFRDLVMIRGLVSGLNPLSSDTA